MDLPRADDMSDSDDSEDEDYVPEGLDESSVTESSEAEPEFEREKSKKNEGSREQKRTKKRKKAADGPPRRRGGIALEEEESDEESEDESSEEVEENSDQSDEDQDEAERERNARAEELFKSFKTDAEALVKRKPVLTKTVGETTQESVTTESSGDAQSSLESRVQSAAASVERVAGNVPKDDSSNLTSNVAPPTTKGLTAPSQLAASAVPSLGGSKVSGSVLKPGASNPSSKVASPIPGLPTASSRLAALAAPTMGATKRSSNALESMLSMASGAKKPKLNTLEQSQKDWKQFTHRAGITDELRQHNKDGFLEKRDFLDRAEVRQWEQERELRMGKRR